MIIEEVSSMPITPKAVEVFNRMMAEIMMRHIEEQEEKSAAEGAG